MKKKNYTYACFELRMQLKNAVALVKIPFDFKYQAIEYINSHADAKFHSRVWLEQGA